MTAKINESIAKQQEQIVAFLKEFIAIESVTYNEKRAVLFAAEKMREFGFDEVRIDKAGNVLGRVGSGKKVLFCDAHIDTVEPGETSEWGFNPLEPKIENGAVWGRGAVDDKGCLTALLFAGKIIKELGLDKDVTVWISGSISEEDVEGSCVSAMLAESGIKPDYVLVAEPSENRLIRAHKGRALLRVTVPGKCAHASAAHNGENALIKALPVIDAIDKFNDFKEHELLGKGTIEVTKVECKTPSLNTIPGEATIICDRRISCGETIEQLLNEIQPFVNLAKGAAATIDTENVTTYTGYEINCVDYFPSWTEPMESDIMQSGIEAFKAAFGKEPVVGKWDFCTNATHFAGREGIPTIGFGPGDHALCHSTAENLSIAELMEAIKFYALFPGFLK